MWKRLRGLQTQFILIIVGITLLLTLFLGFLNLQTINETSKSNAIMSLNWQTQRTSAPVQNILITSSDAIKAMAHSLEADINDPASLQEPEFRAGLKRHLENQFNLMAESSDTIYGYFILFNPALIGRTDGFWYRWSADENRYVGHNQAEINQAFFTPERRDAWFGKALETRQPVWREPFVSPLDGQRKIAYIIPVYVQDRLIGVVGITIRMEKLVEQIRDAKIFETGYAILFSDDGKLFYHPQQPEGADTTLEDFGLEDFAEIFKGRDSNDHLLSYTYQGEPKELAFITLANSMNLGVVAPEAELYADRTWAMERMAFLMVIFGIITSGLAIIVANRIIIPLKAIDEAAKRIGNGDYDTLLVNSRDDEVGELAGNMNRTMVKMKDLVKKLEDQALEDKLTKVKNVTAYEQQEHIMNQHIAAKDLAFSVLMLDVNGLKGINDRFGHAMGNELLRQTVKHLCDQFKHSPVFRVGGDEFVVIVMNEDYEKRYEALQELETHCHKRDYSLPRPWEQLAFATGMSDYDPVNDKTFQEIFLRADAAMYKAKRAAEGTAAR
ncbi:diguanylate cyclase [Acidaminococcus timonensis]|uniref:sensor domain-containing diguanylate cyclase n=1 Tax=Acidaminococcus timonensis TaxID=1871002 RepID=UPI0026ED5F27|nr:diguanylate cyclase [Acidaminococcus timonensis]